MIARLDTTLKKVLVGTVFLALVCYGASWYVAKEQFELRAETERLVTEQAVLLDTLARFIDGDAADPAVAAIVRDCAPAERERFDYLLSNLQALKRSELDEVDRLFVLCGSFYAERRAMMVTRLEREFEIYQGYIALLGTIDSRAPRITYPTETWSKIIALEASRARYTQELVAIQGSIIASLRAGESVTGEGISGALATAKETKDNLSLAGVQLTALRQELGARY